MPGRRLMSARKRRTLQAADSENENFSNRTSTTKSVRKTGRKRRAAKTSRASARGRKAAGAAAVAGGSSTNLAATIDAVETKLFTSRSDAEKALDKAYAEHDEYLQQWFLATKKRLLDNMHVDEASRKSLKTDEDASPGQSKAADTGDNAAATAMDSMNEESVSVGDKRKSRSSESSVDTATSSPTAAATAEDASGSGSALPAAQSAAASPDHKRQRTSPGNEATSSAQDMQDGLLAIEEEVGSMLVKDLRRQLLQRGVDKKLLRQRKAKLAALLVEMRKAEFLQSFDGASDLSASPASVKKSEDNHSETAAEKSATAAAAADIVVEECVVEPAVAVEDAAAAPSAAPSAEMEVQPAAAPATEEKEDAQEAEAAEHVNEEPGVTTTDSTLVSQSPVEELAVEPQLEATVVPGEADTDTGVDFVEEKSKDEEQDATVQPEETVEEFLEEQEHDADAAAAAAAAAVAAEPDSKMASIAAVADAANESVVAADESDPEKAPEAAEASAAVLAAAPAALSEPAAAPSPTAAASPAPEAPAEIESSDPPANQAADASDLSAQEADVAAASPVAEEPTALPASPIVETQSLADDVPVESLHGQSLFQDKMLRMLQKAKTTPASVNSGATPAATDSSATRVSEPDAAAAVIATVSDAAVAGVPQELASVQADIKSADGKTGAAKAVAAEQSAALHKPESIQVVTDESSMVESPLRDSRGHSDAAAAADAVAFPAAPAAPAVIATAAPVSQVGMPLSLAPAGANPAMGELAAAAAALAAHKLQQAGPGIKSSVAADVHENVTSSGVPAASPKTEVTVEAPADKVKTMVAAAIAEVGDVEMADDSDESAEGGDIDLDEVEKLGQKMRDEIRARLKRRLAEKEQQQSLTKGSGVDTVLAQMDSDVTETPHSSDSTTALSGKKHESSTGAAQDAEKAAPASVEIQRPERAMHAAGTDSAHKTPGPTAARETPAAALPASGHSSKGSEAPASASTSTASSSSSTRSMKQPPARVAVAPPTSSTKSRARLNYKEIWKKAQAEAAEQVKLTTATTPSGAAVGKAKPAGREDKSRRGGRVVKPSDKNTAAGSSAALKVIRGGGKARQKVAALEAGKKAREAQERKDQRDAQKRDEADLKRALRVLAHLKKRGQEPTRVGDWAEVQVTSSTSSSKRVVYVNVASRELSRTKPAGWDISQKERARDDHLRQKLKKQALQTYTINRRTHTPMVRVGDWYEVSVGSGTYAYVNRKTKQATPTKPSRWDEIRKRRLVNEVLKEFDIRRSRSIEMDEVDGWFMLSLSNPSRGPFYVNDSTRKVTQKKPSRWDAEMRSRRRVLEEFERSISSKSHTMDQVDGWYEVFVALGTNSTGTLTRAYVHRQSRKIVWQKPSGWDKAVMHAKQQQEARHAQQQRAMQPPEWVQSDNLTRALHRQHTEQHDPELIFGTIPAPVDMEAIFENSSSRKRAKWHSRGDSAQWLPVTTQEKQDCLQAKVELAQENQNTKYDTSEGSGNSSSESSGDDSDYGSEDD